MRSLSSTEPPEAETDSSTKQPFWKSKMFWIIAGVAFAVAVIVLVVVIALVVSDTSAKEEPQWSVQLKKNMDPSIDPCVDFYQYACGGWHAIESVQKSNHEMSFLSTMRLQARKRMMDLLTDPGFAKVNDFLRVPKEYFAACKALGRNESFDDYFTFIKGVGTFPFLLLPKTLNQIVPVLQKTAESMPKLTKLGVASIFSTDVIENSELKRLAIYQPDLYMWTIYKDAYQNWTKEVLHLLGIKQFSGQMYDMFELEDIIMRRLIYADKRRNLTVAELSSVLDWLDVSKFLYEISKDQFNIKGVFSENDVVYVENCDYLERIKNSILKRWDADQDAILNYVMKDLLKLTYALDLRFPAYPGTPADNTDDRSEKCFLETIREFPEVFNRIFADENLHGISMSSIHELISHVKIGYRKNIETNIFNSAPSKSYKLQMLEEMNLAVGYPEYVLNDTHLYNMFNQVNTSRYFWAVVTLRQAKFLNKIKNLKNSKQDTWMWKEHFLNMNDDFANDFNIVLPSVIFRLPVFNPEWPSSMLFGTLGFLTGHQIGHIYRDKIGLELAKRQINCFEDQYNGYTFQEFQVNGTESRYENANDINGLTASFWAHRDYINKYGEGPSLPWLDFTHDQLFFLNFAQMHCQKIPSSLTEAAVQGSKLPQEIRVKGTLHNSKEFSEAFGCTVGTPMNPHKKCYNFGSIKIG